MVDDRRMSASALALIVTVSVLVQTYMMIHIAIKRLP